MLDLDVVRRLCLTITQQGKGAIDISTYLSPNSLLLMGQNGTHRHIQAMIRDVFPHDVSLRTQNYRYPPLHTPIMWQRNIPDRTALLLQTTPGGLRAPSLPVLSMVTGEASYNDFNSRDLIHRWVDQPQRLWDIVYKVLADGIETVVHVGPAPNLVPATFRRLTANIVAQTRRQSWAAHDVAPDAPPLAHARAAVVGRAVPGAVRATDHSRRLAAGRAGQGLMICRRAEPRKGPVRGFSRRRAKTGPSRGSARPRLFSPPPFRPSLLTLLDRSD